MMHDRYDRWRVTGASATLVSSARSLARSCQWTSVASDCHYFRREQLCLAHVDPGTDHVLTKNQRRCGLADTAWIRIGADSDCGENLRRKAAATVEPNPLDPVVYAAREDDPPLHYIKAEAAGSLLTESTPRADLSLTEDSEPLYLGFESGSSRRSKLTT
ncbi:hypothetical protein EDB86DRAFT_2300211 [Lactarius hatsudake]|nr:hypothetical protein EDB86DRAFT_2300211 [Lactarius hatsudake]